MYRPKFRDSSDEAGQGVSYLLVPGHLDGLRRWDVVVNLSVMDLYDKDDKSCETTLFLCFTTKDLEKLHRSSEQGAKIMPVIDMEALGRDVKTRGPITMLQIMVADTDEALRAKCDEIADMLGLKTQRHNDLQQPGYRAGMIQPPTEDTP
jgi:hypothetical protein